MAGVGRDWQIEFRPVHAWIFRGPAAALGYPNCEEGWLDRAERRCTGIEASVVDGRRVRVLQTKEKFGALRFYWSDDFPGAANAKIDEAIALAAARSACTDETRQAEAASTTATTGSRPRAANMPKANSSLSGRDSRTSARPDLRLRPISDRVVPPRHPRDRFLRPRRSEVPRNRGVVAWRVVSVIGGLI